MNKKGFSRAKKVDLKKAEQFISGGIDSIAAISDEYKASQTENIVENENSVKQNTDSESNEINNKVKKKLPWSTADERIPKGLNLRLNEIQWLKLKYISENTPYSMQKFIMKALEPAIEKELIKLIRNK